jgi:Reverse transcriptase (RNA-dependent DNA polymerase)
MVTRSKDNTRLLKSYSDFVAHLTTTNTDPVTFLQANKSSHWREAMALELNALATNNTWTLVPPPTDQKVIRCKWFYKTKQKADGTIDRYKARLVAKGFNQEAGVDYEETYSPVVRATTIRVILALAVSSRWPIKQLDVSNAFLNGDLSEKVYMAQPPGLQDSTHPDFICLLNKSLYGLKQAPRAWFAKLSSTLLDLGFHASCYDPSLFLSHHQGHILLLLVYVDDIVVTGGDRHQIARCITDLHHRFSIRDLGDIHYFLGIEAQVNTSGLYLTQTKYISDLLSRSNMMHCKPCLSPMASGTVLSSIDSPPCLNP